LGGTVAGSAVALTGSSVGAARLPRSLWVATIAAVALHAAVLAIRPGGLSTNYVAPASRVMAVRMVRPLAPAHAAAEPQQQGEPSALVAPSSIQPSAATSSDRPSASAKIARGRVPGEAEASGRVPAGERAPESTHPVLAAAAPPSAAETALPAAPDYAFGVRLDPGPRPLDEIQPDYPDTVHLREGSVVLRLLISDSGHVDDVAVVRSEPRGVFEQAALEAFAKARFSPGLAAGTPVKSQITVEVQFVPTNRGARVSGRTY